jgi:cytoskeleton protein RodZ
MTVPRKEQRPSTSNDMPTPAAGVEPFDRQNLGSRLRAAREAKGLSLNQVADQTRVRVAALEAIDAGDFDRLAEPIYVQSYLRAYAQAVGVPVEPVLEAFRRAGPSMPPPSAVAAAVSRRTIETRPSAGLPLGGILVGLVALVAVAAYIFVSLKSQSLTNPAPVVSTGTPAGITDPPGTGTVAGTEPGATGMGPDTGIGGAVEPGTGEPGTAIEDPSNPASTVNLSVSSVPAGASVLVDGIRIGVTPLVNAPVTSGSSRELRVELDGYKPSIKTVDLSSARSYIANLTVNPPAGTPDTTTPGAVAGQVTLTFQGASWVRITDLRGKRLFEGTPTAGTIKNFAGPVSVRAGRPDLIVASVGGQTRGPLGTAASPTTVRLP